MKHRLFTLLLAVFMLLCAIPAAATETTEPPETTVPERAPGYCGEAILWTFSDSILTITGTGKMDDFPNGAPWEEYKDEIETVIISGGITYVGAHSFYDYDKLKNVEFGSDIIEIGERAFLSCDGLTEIHLPASFTTFGPSSFMGCTRLKEIHCQGRFPHFLLNCMWDTYATIYYPAERPWPLNEIINLEEAFHGRIEFLASDGTDPYEPTEATEETEAPTEEPTEEPTEPPTTVPPTTEAPTEAPTEEVTEPVATQAPTGEPTEAVTEAPTGPEPEKKGGSKVPLYIFIGAAAFVMIGRLLTRGGGKRGKYSR